MFVYCVFRQIIISFYYFFVLVHIVYISDHMCIKHSNQHLLTCVASTGAWTHNPVQQPAQGYSHT